MIVKRYWKGPINRKSLKRKGWCGWFILGIIPLYIKQVT